MESELTVLVLRLAFLALLWIFIFAVVYALRTDLFGPRVQRAKDVNAQPVQEVAPQVQQTVTERIAAQRRSADLPTEAVAPVAAATPPIAAGTPPVAASAPRTPAPAPTSNRARRLVITSGPKEGLEVELAEEQLTIGRSGESGLVIRDDYTSTHHARLMLWNDDWMLQDLDSTNGTFLDGSRVTVPVRVPVGTPVKIGTTTFELRR